MNNECVKNFSEVSVMIERPENSGSGAGISILAAKRKSAKKLTIYELKLLRIFAIVLLAVSVVAACFGCIAACVVGISPALFSLIPAAVGLPVSAIGIIYFTIGLKRKG